MLNTGQVLPAIGLCTFQDPDEQEMSLYTALKNGYRHIDTAHKSGFPPALKAWDFANGHSLPQLWHGGTSWQVHQAEWRSASGNLYHDSTLVQRSPSRTTEWQIRENAEADAISLDMKYLQRLRQ